MLSQMNDALMQLLARFRCQEGQALAEYGLILAFIFVACIVALGFIGFATAVNFLLPTVDSCNGSQRAAVLVGDGHPDSRFRQAEPMRWEERGRRQFVSSSSGQLSVSG